MRLPRTFHNLVSYAGAATAALGLLLFVFLFVLHTVTEPSHAPYAGLVIFVLIPGILVVGLLTVPIGMLREWRRLRRMPVPAVPRFPVIDLNDPRYRNATGIFILGTILLLFLSAFGSYQAYESTESVSFCGALCHNVMEPEYVTYQNSPHARVACVECHVGPGADWWAKSKLSGLYQVYAVALEKYPRPIPAPIESLRPARDTCEQCHWPDQFFGGMQKKRIHFLPDEQNTRWEIQLLIKIGGGTPVDAHSEGIHWHMNLANQIEYIATDPQRQEIPWVRVTDLRTGRSTEYVTAGTELSEQDIAAAEIRSMDCMDCHNRPTHIFRSPTESMNLALAAGRIDSTLPFVKRTAVEMLSEEYASTEEAFRAIRDGLLQFYSQSYPELAETRREAIERAVSATQEIYQNNFFPHMKVRWSVYPDHAGHFMFPGCTRCHDGLHQSADGQVITKECTACHTIMAQGTPEAMAFATTPGGLEFQHPVDIGEMWREMPCSGCHTGG